MVKTTTKARTSAKAKKKFSIELIKGNRYSIRRGETWRVIRRGQVIEVDDEGRNYFIGTGYFRDYIYEPKPDLVPEVDAEVRDPGQAPSFDVVGESRNPLPKGVDFTERGTKVNQPASEADRTNLGPGPRRSGDVVAGDNVGAIGAKEHNRVAQRQPPAPTEGAAVDVSDEA